MNRGHKKTVCRYFAATGSCFYGDQCQFQHVRQLSQPKVHPPSQALGPGPLHMVPVETRKKGDFPSPHAPRLYPTPLNSKSRNSGLVPARPALHPSNADYGLASRVGRLGLPPSSSRLKTPALGRDQAQVDAGGTTYFFSREHQPAYPSGSSMYSGPPTHVAKANTSKEQGFFTSEGLRQELLHRQEACLSLPADGVCPPEVDHYHTLCPLESIDQTGPEQKSQRTFGHACTCYRATSSKDGLYYCLRRVHQLRLTSGKAVLELEKWRKLQHTNLVMLREMFTTKAFGDNSVVFVHDYHAGAESLAVRYLQGRRKTGCLPEDLVWDYVIQLVSALRLIHSSGLALRCIDATKVLLTGRHSTRLCINCAGVMDILTFDGSSTSSHSITIHQQEDLAALGELLMCVALQSPSAAKPENYHVTMDTLATHYSPGLHQILQYLVHSGSKGPPHNIVEVLPMIGGRVYTSLERAHLHQDRLEAELGKEMQNGRLFRLLAKLGTIIDRPEFAGDEQWSQTGDRYLLKLFQDYLFHQVLPSGTPWVDLAHIVQTLNKLDAGSEESVILHAQDEQSVLVVSYADLKTCLETTFSQVLASSK